MKRLLSELAPCWYRLKTSLVLHAFRLWGHNAQFPQERFSRSFTNKVFSGDELCKFLLDDRYYRKLSAGPPLLSLSEYGVSTRTTQPVESVVGVSTDPFAHINEILCVTAELGFPLDFPVYTREGESTVRALLNHSLACFDPDDELEFSVEAFSRYLIEPGWHDRFGRHWTLDELVDRLLEPKIGAGVCLGTHRIQALVTVLIADHEMGFLTSSRSARIIEFLNSVSELLVSQRGPYQMWLGNWAGQALPGGKGEELAALIASGHHLEWIAVCPVESALPRKEIVQQVLNGGFQFAATLSAYDRADSYLALSHFAQAVCRLLDTSAYQLLGDA